MQEIINVNLNDNHEPVVSGRQLHEALGVNSNYTTWFDRMTDYGFTENEDYILLSNFGNQTGRGGHNKVDHIIKLDMAKEIAMIQRTDKGKQVRQYFIQVEKDFNSPEKIMARALLMADKKITHLTMENTQLQIELQEAQKQARYLDLIIESKGALRVTQIAADYGMSANKFNKTLLELGVQHKVNGQWILYKKHMGKGYTDSHTFDYQDKNGHTRANVTTTWTQKGRLFLYELLKDNGILPLIEQDDVA
ncbi:TPA: phage antirepressor KilAC domain-containing protein [Streptococcus suis]|nr:phage antirepressor KilAC domain-containing protein [Streptococcus suis]HEM3700354.1 phage antirepressor KilAC domain-containing protein [Streptococcus suis]